MRAALGCLSFVLILATMRSESAVDTYDTLRARIRTAPLLELSDPKFPAVLVIGSRFAGQLIFTTVTIDPLDPETLDDHFDEWNLSARASLLLDYARLMTEPDTPRPYAGIPERDRRDLQAWDAEARARIAQVARVGSYAADWRAFIRAYRKFLSVAEGVIPPGDTPDDGAFLVYKAVGQAARDQGLYRLIRELRIDPDDVTNEMFRLRTTSRAKLGGPSDASTDAAYLLYTCPSKSAVNVNVHTWHKLAPAFFQALAISGKHRNDPDATLIVTTFEGLGAAIKAWIAAHPDAGSADRDRELNQIAAKRGLISLLEHYGAPAAPTQSPGPEALTSP
jgi:hypothetical protein